MRIRSLRSAFDRTLLAYLLFGLLLGSGASGCQAYIEVAPGPVERNDVRQHDAVVELLQRASFEFDCPSEEIELVAVEDFRLLQNADAAGPGTQLGAKGCGQRGLYVYTAENGWVLDSAGAGGITGDSDGREREEDAD